MQTFLTVITHLDELYLVVSTEEHFIHTKLCGFHVSKEGTLNIDLNI